MSNVSIIGAHNTQFGAFVKKDKATGLMTDTKTYYDLLIEAGRGAIADAGLEAKDIDAVFVGSCSPGSFVNQEHVAPIAAEIHPDLRFKPMTRCECACASGSVALYAALYAVEAGRAKRVLDPASRTYQRTSKQQAAAPHASQAVSTTRASRCTSSRKRRSNVAA